MSVTDALRSAIRITYDGSSLILVSPPVTRSDAHQHNVAPRPTTAGDLHKNKTAFLQSFAAREAQNQAARQKPTLSIEQHAAHRAQLTDVRFIKPKYSDQTEINVSGIFNKWRRYCTDLNIQVGDWKATIQNLTRETTQDFVLHLCERYKITS